MSGGAEPRPYAPSTDNLCVYVTGRTESSAPTLRLPHLRLILALSFRGREAPVGIRSPFHINGGLGRHLPLPLRGKGAI